MLKVAARPLVDDRVVVKFEGGAPLNALFRVQVPIQDREAGRKISGYDIARKKDP